MNINALPGLELTQIGWVVPDINAAVKFLSSALGIAGFHEPETFRAHDFGMTYFGQAVPGEWLITQAYIKGPFIELIQPVSGQSIFHDYLVKYPAGGIQHMAFRMPIAGFDQVISELRGQGHAIISQLDHPIAKIVFFDTYQTVGVATEVMGITPEGWSAIEQMEKRR